jgi:REP element-mobilizing transposase RayT
MCRNRRDRRKSRGQVYFITARARKGLPFVARLSVEKVILGILARAQSLYPVKLCSYVFMGNHYHLILTGQSCHISPFMNYIQGNIAKAMQRLIPNYYDGWFWEDRYKEQLLLTAEDVIEKMAYIYLNPVRARLVEKASEYPSINSYNRLTQASHSILTKWIPIKKLKELPVAYNSKEDIGITSKLLSAESGYTELRVEPFAWFSSFREELTQETVTKRLLERVKEEELKYNTPVLGAKTLRTQATRKHYIPESKTRTPYLICSDKELRIEEIGSYQTFCSLCRQAWALIKKGIKAVWPKGAYLPSIYRGCWALSG